MAEYSVSGTMTISIHCTVEADSEEAAKQAAEDADIMKFCHQCAGGPKRLNVWSTSGELDGTPQVDEIEKLK